MIRRAVIVVLSLAAAGAAVFGLASLDEQPGQPVVHYYWRVTDLIEIDRRTEHVDGQDCGFHS